MVIECPSCKTKFALDSQQLAEVENPRFHCSRCNHIFEFPTTESIVPDAEELNNSDSFDGNVKYSSSDYDTHSKKLAPEAENNDGKLSTGDSDDMIISPESYQVDSEQLDLIPEKELATEIPDSSITTRSQFKVEQRPNSPMDDSDISSQFTAQWPSSNASEVFEVDLSSYRDDQPLSAQKELVPPLTSDDSQQTSNQNNEYLSSPSASNLIEASWSKKAEDQFRNQPNEVCSSSMELGQDYHSDSEEIKPLSSGIESIPEKFTFASGETKKGVREQERKAITPDFTNPPQSMARHGQQIRTHSKLTGFGGLLFTLSIPICLTLLFGLWGRSIEKTPQGVQNLLSLNDAPLPRIPPPGLGLVGVQSKLLTLDNGMKVLEISGDMFNATLKSYHTVQLQAVIYDEHNTALNYQIVSPNENINKARIEALDQEQIETMQEESSRNRLEIKPNKRQPFKVFFTGLSGTEKFFSTKVYSVMQGT